MILNYNNFIPDTQKASFIADNATISGNVTLNENSNIWFGAVVRSENNPVIIGEKSNVQDNCTVHTDPGHSCIIGKNVTIGHNAVVHGCEIGDNCLIGMGAVVMNGAKIGEGSIVGAGALVTQNKVFPPHSMIIGSPAKAVKVLDEDALKGIIKNANHYVNLALEYRKGQHNNISKKQEM